MLYLELIILYNDIAIRFHYYNILLIVSIIKCIRKEAVFNEVYIIIFITRLLLMNCLKNFVFFKRQILFKMCVCFQSLVLIFECSVQVQLQRRGKQIFWHFGQEQCWLLNSILPWKKLPSQKKFCYLFLFCRISVE